MPVERVGWAELGKRKGKGKGRLVSERKEVICGIGLLTAAHAAAATATAAAAHLCSCGGDE
jgi:hypothetical protein